MIKFLIALIIMGFILVPAYAESPAYDYSHSQGNGDHCATSPTIEMTCEIYNILDRLLTPMLDYVKNISGNSAQIDNDLKTIIANQEIENNLLSKIANQNDIPSQPTIINGVNCHKQGTGMICG